VNNTFQATFLRPHAQGFGITIAGNPGPQPLFDSALARLWARGAVLGNAPVRLPSFGKNNPG